MPQSMMNTQSTIRLMMKRGSRAVSGDGRKQTCRATHTLTTQRVALVRLQCATSVCAQCVCALGSTDVRRALTSYGVMMATNMIAMVEMLSHTL